MTLSVPVPLPPPTVSARMHARFWVRVRSAPLDGEVCRRSSHTIRCCPPGVTVLTKKLEPAGCPVGSGLTGSVRPWAWRRANKGLQSVNGLISKPRAATISRCRQRGSGGANRRSGLATWSGSQIGTNCHLPARAGTGTYSVVQPHQAGMWSVRPGCHPCGRRCSVRMRMTATSRPQVQHARVGRRRPAASSQMGGVTGSLQDRRQECSPHPSVPSSAH
jgi:hypothetical protein